MSVSFQNRNIAELNPANARSFGMPAAALPSVRQLDLRHNQLRTLEAPFTGSRGPDSAAARAAEALTQSRGRPLPLRADQRSGPNRTTSDAAAAASLEAAISGLRLLTSLSELRVCHNPLRSLRGLCGVADTLTTLVATHASLTSLDGMQACRRLRNIDVSHNSIDSLRGLPLLYAGDLPAPSSAVAAAAAQRGAAPSAASHTDVALALSGIADSADTSSLAFSCHSSPGEAPRLHLNHTRTDTNTAAAAAAAAASRGRSVSTDTSLQFHVEESPTASVAAGAAAAAAAASPHDSPHPSKDSSGGARSPGAAAAVGVVLNLSHNRLRGAALAALLWVDDAAGTSALPLLRPWSTALVRLDLSHNFIEDAAEVRRLVATVDWPVEAATPAAEAPPPSRVLCAAALPRLQRLDVSHNPFLVNGSLAREVVAAAGARHTAAPPRGNDARRATATPAQALSMSPGVCHGALSVQLRYTSAALRAALRESAAVPATAALSNAEAAQAAMEAAVADVAATWQRTPLLAPPPSAQKASFVLFNEAALCAAMAAAAAGERGTPATSREVLLHGGEVTVWAAVAQLRGARLAEVVRVDAAEAPTAAPRQTLRSSVAAGGRHADRSDTTLDVFLTPPPRWGAETATSTTFHQVSLLEEPSTLRRRSAETTGVEASWTPSQRAETSTLGYRLYARRSSQDALEAATQPPSEGEGDGWGNGDAAAGMKEGVVSLNRAPHTTPSFQTSGKSVATETSEGADKAEVAALRSRVRELQQFSREQADAVVRHEAVIRDLTAQVAAAQAALADAQRELQRLRSQKSA